MSLINPQSLSKTLDNVNEKLFFNESISTNQSVEVSLWLANRQGKKGSYANMFAPTREDFSDGIRLFTGESIISAAAIGHILGEEASRILISLQVEHEQVTTALERARPRMIDRINNHLVEGGTRGMYCCGKCSVALWRHWAVGGLDNGKEHLLDSVQALRAHRDGKGRWSRFPFYYTLLALTELDHPKAINELRYAIPSLERSYKRKIKSQSYMKRRHVLAERIFSLV